MKQNIRLVIIIIMAIATVLIVLKARRESNPANLLQTIREQNKAGFDSLQNAINHENDLNYRIQKSISIDDFKTAYSLMESLPPFGKTHSILLYQGMIFEKQKKYTEAIEKFTEAINELPYSKAQNMRGDVYVKMNKLELALADYKEIYNYNHYYSSNVANTFILMNKKDSALKYYQIYLEHYPNNSAVRQKAKKLLSH